MKQLIDLKIGDKFIHKDFPESKIFTFRGFETGSFKSNGIEWQNPSSWVIKIKG